MLLSLPSRRLKSKRHHCDRLEALESRRLLAGDVIINEFLAENNDSLLDYYDESSDWLELLNTGPSRMDLAGWYLTDDSSNLQKWQFPESRILAPQDLLVVHASGRDLIAPNDQLHTNFVLDPNGEYLALVEPDGSTISWESRPQFPPQFEEVSFGRFTGEVTTTLVDATSVTDVLVPLTAVDLDAFWLNPGFQPNGWQNGTMSVGFDRPLPTQPDSLAGLRLWLKADDIVNGAEPLNGSTVNLWQDRSGNGHNAAAATDVSASITGPKRQEVTVSLPGGDNTFPVLRFASGADELLRAADIIGPPDANGESAENENFGELTIITVYSTSFLSVANRTLGFGLSASRGGVDADNLHLANDPSIQKDNGNISGHTQGVPAEFFVRTTVMTASGDGLVEEFFDGTSVLNSTENYPVRSDNFYLGDTRFPFGFGADIAEVIVYDRALDEGARQSVENYLSDKFFNSTVTGSDGPYAEIFDTNLTASMQSQNSSAFVRTEFDVADLAGVDRLELGVQYDDGFVAYLNGLEVASRNAPASPDWNSAATTEHPDEQAVGFEVIDIRQHANVLTTTDNVLAIQGLNIARGDSDFLLVATLTATDEYSTDQLFFETPTPGQPNTPGAVGVVGDTMFSIDRGFFDAPVDVAISTTTPGAEIRYTTDGSPPTSTTGLVYSGPVQLTTTTTIRAAAFKTDHISSNVDTHTYLFLDDVITQTGAGFPTSWVQLSADYQMDPNVVNNPAFSSNIKDGLKSLPTLSLVMDEDSWFNPSSNPAVGGIIPNSLQRGSRWERAVSAELIHSDGLTGFQIDAGVRVHGGGSRRLTSQPKTTFRLEFRGQYGPRSLNYPLFGPTAVDSFDTLVLRATYDDAWSGAGRAKSSYIRDPWLAQTQLSMGQLSSHGQFVHVYINGLYWGMYNIIERPDADFGASYLGGTKEEYDSISAPGHGTVEATDGNTVAYNAAKSIANGGLASSAQYELLKQYIDVENLADYMAMNIFGGNQHWPSNNWFMLRRREPGAGFKFITWDGEGVFRDVTTNQSHVNGANGPAFFYNALRQNAEFRVLFGDRVHRHFFNDGVLTPQVASDQWTELTQVLKSPLVAESARWGDFRGEPPFTPDSPWASVVNGITTMIPQRNTIVLNQLRGIGLYPNTDAPSFSQHGGPISAGFTLTMTNENGSGTIYYTTDGQDPRLAGGGISTFAQVYAGPLSLPASSTTVKVRVRDGSSWSALNEATFTPDSFPLRITEIHYNPSDTLLELGELVADNDSFEFLELMNTGSQAIDLTGVQLVQVDVGGDSQGINFDFASQMLNPSERIVVVENLVAFQSRYGTSVRVADGDDGQGGPGGQYGGKLSNNGERLTLLDGSGQVIQQFTYDDTGQWPGRADGNGSTLEVIDTQGNYDDANNWRSSIDFLGSPGAAGSSPTDDVLVNEVLANSDLPSVDAIELFNTSGTPIDLSGWYLSDSNADYLKYVFPTGTTIPADGYLVIDENDFNAGGGLGPGDFQLSSFGDDVTLLSSDGSGRPLKFMDRVEFKATLGGVSLGRVPNEDVNDQLVPQTRVTLGAVNLGHRPGEIVISEVHFNPPDADDTGREFVELFNTTVSPIDLGGWRLDRAVDYEFSSPALVAAGETVVVVDFDPVIDTAADALFRSIYGIDASVQLVGPWGAGKTLDNGGEAVRLERDADRLQAGQTQFDHILIDQVSYEDDPPWPASADGGGDALHRRNPVLPGSSSGSWSTAFPTPGSVDFSAATLADFDGDDFVGANDIDLLSSGVVHGSVVLYFDVNGSSAVDDIDVDHLVQNILGTNYGDTDLDNDVDTGDLTNGIINFTGAGGVGKLWSDGDTDGDGDVDTRDLTTAIIRFTGAASGASATLLEDADDGVRLHASIERGQTAKRSVATSGLGPRSRVDAESTVFTQWRAAMGGSRCDRLSRLDSIFAEINRLN